MRDPRLDDTGELRRTQPLAPTRPPTTLPEGEYGGKPKRKRDDRRSNPLYLPAWSVGLMLLLVFGIAVGIVSLVVMIGGQSLPGGEPRVIIVTAVPTATSDQPPTLTPDSAALQGGTPSQTIQQPDAPLPSFALEGPTLPPIILSPTPITITLGAAVLVNIEGLNVRPEPGLNNTPRFNASLGAGFNVVGGPLLDAGLTWWEIQDPADPTRRGWAAADYLDVFAP